jgi:hypothetical protein
MTHRISDFEYMLKLKLNSLTQLTTDVFRVAVLYIQVIHISEYLVEILDCLQQIGAFALQTNLLAEVYKISTQSGHLTKIIKL